MSFKVGEPVQDSNPLPVLIVGGSSGGGSSADSARDASTTQRTVVMGGLSTSVGTTNTFANTTANFVVGDLLPLVGGTYTTQAVMRVSSVDGNGKITGLQLQTQGVYSVLPSNPVSVTTNSAAGNPALVTLTATWVPVVQTLFGGAIPAEGWKVNSPGAATLYVTDDGSTPATADGYTVFPNGGQFGTEPWEKPAGGAVKVLGTLIGSIIRASMA